MLGRQPDTTSMMSADSMAAPTCPNTSNSPLNSPLNSQELAARVSAGDRAAFAQLVQLHLPRTVAVAQRILMRRAEAEDVAQDVFIKYWQNPQAYQPGKALFATWLYRVTVNRALDVARKAKPLPLDENYDQEDPALSVIEQQAQKQRAQALAQAVALLPERQRAAIALSYQTELSDVDAAAALDITVKAYESLLVRARRTLREMMLKGGHHDAG